MTAPHRHAKLSGMDQFDGVSLETYTIIIKELGARGGNEDLLVEIARTHGLTATQWKSARDGWGTRLKNDPAVSSRFNSLFTG